MFMSPSSYLCAQGVAENNQFFDWKESDYKAYEDSLLKALYPPVIAKTAENPERFSQQPQAFVPKAISDNTYVPTTVTIDKSKAVGEIPIQTGVSPTGAKTYTVPIQVYPASLVLDGVLAVCNRSCVRVGIFIMMVSPKELYVRKRMRSC